MNNKLEKLHQEAQSVRLSTSEKAVMHASIMERVHAGAASQKEGGAPRQTPGLFFYFANPQFAMSFAALFVVVLGGGTVFAAQGSLPGDPLYALKTGVSEPIQGALAFSVESKINYHAQMAQTRLEEAEVLASQNRLDAKAGAQIESNLDTHLAERQALVGKLEEQRPGVTFAASAKYDTQITAHGDVLVQLGAESSSSTTREYSNTIAMRVRTSGNSYGYNARGANTIAMAKAPAPMAMSLTGVAQEDSSSTTEDAHIEMESPSTDDKKVDTAEQSAHMKSAMKLGTKATTSLEALRVSAQKMKDVDESTQARLDSRFAKIESLIAEGNAAIETQDFDVAKDSFNEALDRSVTLSTFISANLKFNHGILGNLLGNDSRWGNDEGE
jgi:hypothetical protein